LELFNNFIEELWKVCEDRNISLAVVHKMQTWIKPKYKRIYTIEELIEECNPQMEF